MRGFSLLLISTILIIILAQAVSGSAVPITQTPALYVSDYGEGVSHPINSYNLTTDGAVSGGAWMLLATNDQATFARIDARKDIDFSAGETRQYDVANPDPYRWYYLYLQDGFPVGSNLDFHLNELSPAPTPTPSHMNDVDISIERVPLVVIADFGGTAMNLESYTLTSSETLPGGQSWQLYGTNDPAMLGSNNLGAFTLLDNQSGVGFVSGVPQEFNVTTSSDFLYYVFYLQSGFSVSGMNLEIQFHESGEVPTPTPTPTPTVTPTPTPPGLPVADFDGSPRAGYAPLQVSFTDESTGTITTWSWDFGDGGTSSEENPVHVYTGTGLFNVNLTVCNEGGCSWLNRTSYVFTLPPPSATPTGTPRYYINIGGGSTGSSSTGSSRGTQSATGSGAGATGSSGSAGTSSDSGTTVSNGVQGSQGAGNTAGQGSGMPNPEQSRLTSAAGIPAVIQALEAIRTATGALLESLIRALRHLLGM
jgi:PKD repeat protein